MKLKLLLTPMLLIIFVSASFAVDSQFFARGGGDIDGVSVKILDVSTTDPGMSYPSGSDPDLWPVNIQSGTLSGTIYVRVLVKAYHTITLNSPITLYINGFQSSKIITKTGPTTVYNSKLTTIPPQPQTVPYHVLYKFSFNSSELTAPNVGYNGACKLHATVNYTPNSNDGDPAASNTVTININNGMAYDYDENVGTSSDGNSDIPLRVIIAYESINSTAITFNYESSYISSLKGSFNVPEVFLVPTTLIVGGGYIEDSIQKMSALSDFITLCQSLETNKLNGLVTKANKPYYETYLTNQLKAIADGNKNKYKAKTYIILIRKALTSDGMSNGTTRGIAHFNLSTFKTGEGMIVINEEYITSYMDAAPSSATRLMGFRGSSARDYSAFGTEAGRKAYRGNVVAHELGHTIGIAHGSNSHCKTGEYSASACLMASGDSIYNQNGTEDFYPYLLKIYTGNARYNTSYDSWCANHKSTVKSYLKM